MSDFRILGIDPGLNTTGYGLIDIKKNKASLVKFGHIRTKAKESLSQRLHVIFNSLDAIIADFKPDRVAIEDIFYADNVKTAIVMGHARGAAIVAATKNNASVTEFTAREVKMSVVGNGAASKNQVSFMVSNILRIKEKITPEDASDALAVALCQMNRLQLEAKGLS
ncbi:MAG: crossover junction endodeoxyribonuclease RuvC [Calditrichaeota bacterium]|nr:MAG: crossover junction endodeoxyribonuclease RuvC [Calditrichota bacterium]MBL1206940.1 crossover junction endodeoxyribonuclease RuvC [Calditrichota bacterium]NOG46767.1 crossover junction endodeoxyribonuclease RuvC [Calditrichota bacterium]